jgi:two-component system sensor histidine kinase TctE
LGRSRRLTEQLLSLAHASQAEAAQREEVDLARICREAVVQHLPLAREKDQDLGWVDARAGADGAPVIAGEVELREILANLVHNAIHYSPAGARITVALAEERDCYEVAVIDNGPGIPEHQREQVFRRFERAGRQDAAGGSGLGLSIARAYARGNRGEIDLRDGEANATGGRGLSAVLRLPRTPENDVERKTGNRQKNDSIARGFSLFSEKIHWFERK